MTYNALHRERFNLYATSNAFYASKIEKIMWCKMEKLNLRRLKIYEVKENFQVIAFEGIFLSNLSSVDTIRVRSELGCVEFRFFF